MRFIILTIAGLSAGAFAAFGLCAVLTSVGIITRIAWKTHTSNRVRLYENCIFCGAVASNILYLAQPEYVLSEYISIGIMGFIGIFFGIFVGCLAVALAETLDGFTIVFRRIKITKGVEYILLAIALGKVAGSLIFFFIV